MRSSPCWLLVACTYIFDPPDLPEDVVPEPDTDLTTLPPDEPPTAPLSGAVWSVGPDELYHPFADSVASAGDVNADGYDDIVIGSYDTAESRASVFLGSADGPETGAVWEHDNDQADSQYERSVASAGDVNGDGFDDVLVGAPYFDGQIAYDEGKAYLFLGSPYSGLDAEFWWRTESGQVDAHLGHVVAAGDVNCDGYPDIVVGAPDFYNYSENRVGKASVYFGLGSVVPTQIGNDQELQSSQSFSAHFAWSVASADVDGDGCDDVIVGAPDRRIDSTDAFLYLGSPSGLETNEAWFTSGEQLADFGSSVASGGDVDADGFADVIVGAPYYDNGDADNPDTDEGGAFLYYGSKGGIRPDEPWTGEPDVAFALYGTAVASAGDVNADGHADVVVGAPGYSAALDDAGKVYVYLGSMEGLGAIAWSAEPSQGNSQFGATVAAAGDVNGDGCGDLIIGAPTYATGDKEGAAFVYLGQGDDASADSDGDGVADSLCR